MKMVTAIVKPFKLDEVREALSAIGVEPRDALFVGDRVREDYEGPRALGIRAVIFTAHTDELPPSGIPMIASLSDLLGLL